MLYFLLFILFLACFLIGMMWLRTGLLKLSGSKLEEWLKRTTYSPFSGMFIGILMTVILQSSSAVMVIAVGLVSARILTFPQTIGIILGTNIGTTLTLEFFTVDLTTIIVPCIVLGICFLLLPFQKIQNSGSILLGIGMIFTAIHSFEWLSHPLSTFDSMQKLLSMMGNHIFFAFVIGMIFTAIIQSSTVMTGIAMSFLSAGVFPLETGIAIMLGANIGTCSTAFIAGIGSGQDARLTAFAHIWLNVIGCLAFLPFIGLLANMSEWLSARPDVQLAHSSVMFNVICSFMVLPFSHQFARFIIYIHGKKSII